MEYVDGMRDHVDEGEGNEKVLLYVKEMQMERRNEKMDIGIRHCKKE